MRRHAISGADWDRVKGAPGPKSKAGNRLLVDRVLWIARTGSPWRDRPDRFGNGNSVWRRFRRWAEAGVWGTVLELVRDPDRGPRDAFVARSRTARARARELDGAAEARRIAVACSDPPDGRDAWTVRMLADKRVESEVVEVISDETARRALESAPQAVAQGAVAHPGRTRRCVRGPDGGRNRGVPPALRPGAPTGVYRRATSPTDRRNTYPAPGPAGRGDSIMSTAQRDREPVPGVRPTGRVAPHRGDTAAHGEGLRGVPGYVVDEAYAEADRVALVTDDLNVRGSGSLYEALDPATARRGAARIEWHYAPKHGAGSTRVLEYLEHARPHTRPGPPTEPAPHPVPMAEPLEPVAPRDPGSDHEQHRIHEPPGLVLRTVARYQTRDPVPIRIRNRMASTLGPPKIAPDS
ncbi:Uncharacterized protein OS=Hymenobacter swuensis DY53 GN=Hsw_1114 PE=4 SV=1: DUF4096: HTH_29 [Gemmata massiliana]|uniref:Insertion element IS402-like domain-containing protein n=1 Tax=Gemmata massiliana TaxID=1210884 RepID=A0A6P2D042_9BACT|nr:Uncharacterized protein OS=Hymenobacter swuensis DY53 GN=Hsw_1114 PE=4 SV=1: DUF4096: HTH_29 [Gemmata massiliana]